MPEITHAASTDIPELLVLVNSAYRGEASRKGWTTEADFLAGDLRTDAESLQALLDKPGAVILKYSDESAAIRGCVYLEIRADRLYLGMLSVQPDMQDRGIGKQLLAAAVAHAHANNCRSIFMRVLSRRQELIAWYERHGYLQTGRREPYDAPPQFGVMQEPLEFLILEKVL